ncbi:MAG TPA: hypothetical protein VED37_01985 [Ktedonobacteraceae bacterium]|nr:hypothetical protein [Ktedonobacteraceae bacterium]
MYVVLGLVPFFLVISIVWPIVAIAKEQSARKEYSFTACVAGWYAQIMAMVGIIVFTAGLGYLFKGVIGYFELYYSYGFMSFPIVGALCQTNVAYLEQQRLVDLIVRAPSLLVAGPVLYFVFAYLSRTVSAQRIPNPYWVMRGSQLIQTIFLGTTSVLCGLLALNLVLGYFLISPIGNQLNVPFGEMLGFALAFTGAFVAHIWIWRSYPGGTWWSPPEGWPGRVQRTSSELEESVTS